MAGDLRLRESQSKDLSADDRRARLKRRHACKLQAFFAITANRPGSRRARSAQGGPAARLRKRFAVVPQHRNQPRWRPNRQQKQNSVHAILDQPRRAKRSFRRQHLLARSFHSRSPGSAADYHGLIHPVSSQRNHRSGTARQNANANPMFRKPRGKRSRENARDDDASRDRRPRPHDCVAKASAHAIATSAAVDRPPSW